jgi:hypothetical protein
VTIPIHRLDLRGDRAHSAAAVAEARQLEADRFLVLDNFAELPDHQRLYESLLAHDPVPTLCLAVGAPDDADDTDEEPADIAFTPAVLRRPIPLRPPGAGVVWIPDPACGDGQPPQEDALRPLVDLFTEPAVFDAVLEALVQVAEGVAVPALDVLEQCLSPSARGRVWREAIERLAGQETPVAAFVTGPPEDVPTPLAPLVSEEMPRSLAGHAWLVGRLRQRHETCGTALTAARDAFDTVRHPLAPLTGAVRHADLPTRMVEAADALDAYHAAAAETLKEGDVEGVRADRRARLFQLGINLPDSAEGSREPVGPALRSYTESHLRRGVSLRSAAARLAALAQRAIPVGSAARIARLEEACPAEDRARLRRPGPFPLGSPSRWVNAAESGAVALLAGLWPGAGWVFGPAAGLACAGVAAFLASRRPNRDADGRLDGGVADAGGRLAGGIAGGLAGAAAGQLLGPPLWLALTTLVLAVAGLVFLGQQWWTRAVDDWWNATDPERVAGWQTAIGDVLTEAAVRDWFFRDAREYCAATADTAAVTLHAMADTAERHATPDAPPAGRDDATFPNPDDPDDSRTADWDAEDAGDWGSGGDGGDWDSDGDGGDWATTGWDDWGDGPTGQTDQPEGNDSGAGAGPVPAATPTPTPTPPWLRRETGDGGKALVETLAGDLTAGAVHVLGGLWGGVEAAPENAGTQAVRERMTLLLDEERERLASNPGTPPSFAPDPGSRPGPAALFGLSDESVTALLAARAETPGRPLCARAHRNALSRDPAAARRVCFAPDAMRHGDRGHADGWDATGEDVVWTRSGRFTGVARLLPLRHGFVGAPRTRPEGPAS